MTCACPFCSAPRSAPRPTLPILLRTYRSDVEQAACWAWLTAVHANGDVDLHMIVDGVVQGMTLADADEYVETLTGSRPTAWYGRGHDGKPVPLPLLRRRVGVQSSRGTPSLPTGDLTPHCFAQSNSSKRERASSRRATPPVKESSIPSSPVDYSDSDDDDAMQLLSRGDRLSIRNVRRVVRRRTHRVAECCVTMPNGRTVEVPIPVSFLLLAYPEVIRPALEDSE